VIRRRNRDERVRRRYEDEPEGEERRMTGRGERRMG
jgi:hypothetical protein